MGETKQKIKVLVTGSNGQLGQELRQLEKEYEQLSFIYTTKSDFDITNVKQIQKELDLRQPDVVINAAAYTQVDQAENESKLAEQINTNAVENLAIEARSRHIKLFHISTDYVFDGLSKLPYTTSHETNPQTIYGKTKLAGEEKIIHSGVSEYAIIRTSWLYGVYANNFVKTMLRLSSERAELSVVNDQVGSPTWSFDLARTILEMIPQINKENSGIYHYSNKGEVSWYAFAKAIFKNSNRAIKLTAVNSDQFPTIAPRPRYSVLDCSNIEEKFHLKIPHWEESLKDMLGHMKLYP